MKNQIKLIVTDLDGTLLKSDKTVSEYTKAVFTRYRETGMKICYATGRGRSAETVTLGMVFDGRIAMNGAIVIAGHKIIYNRQIPWQTARPVLVACDKRGLKTASEISNIHYTNFKVSEFWPDFKNFEIVDFSSHEKDAEKLYVLVDNQEDAAYIEEHLPEELYSSLSRDGMVMIMHKDATKSKAIAVLSQYWNIKQHEIVVFGDDLNDIDMLQYAGTSIAMENALAEVKAVARHICPSNDEDGMAKWIEENLM